MIPVLTERRLSEVAIIEEASELIKELCKAERFGWHEKNYLDSTTPMMRFASELGDLIGSIAFFLETHPEIEQYEDVMEENANNRKARLIHFNNLATRDTPFVAT
jgi:hypothetical protein